MSGNTVTKIAIVRSFCQVLEREGGRGKGTRGTEAANLDMGRKETLSGEGSQERRDTGTRGEAFWTNGKARVAAVPINVKFKKKKM